MDTDGGSILLLTDQGRAEHVALEAEPIPPIYPTKQRHRIARSRYRLRSWLHGRDTELTLLEGHHVRVQNHASAGARYELDLRYINPQPRRVRHIAWLWLAVFVTSGAVAAGAFSIVLEHATVASPLWVGAGALLVSAASLLFFLRRTTESLQFLSEHGRATLMSVTGGLGAVRQGKPFFVELIKSIHAARTANRQTRQQSLCNEMREHHRLREIGVLTEREYSQSKARILAQH